MAEPQREGLGVWIGDVLAAITGGVLGSRWQRQGQPGAIPTPKGSLRAAIYKPGITPAKRQQALDFLTGLEARDPFGLARLQGVMTNDDLHNMLKEADPADWQRSIPPSTLTHVQTAIHSFVPPTPKPRWWQTGLKYLCIAILIIFAFWVAFPQLHN